MERERRAIKIVEFFLEYPHPLNKIHKLYYPFRKFSLMKRVFSDKNEYTMEDIEAWEEAIKRIKKSWKNARKKGKR